MANKFSFRKRAISFKYAFRGLAYVVRTQHNIWIDIILAIVAVLLGFTLSIGATEWMILVIVISIVLAAEVFNTAIEIIVDFISPQRNDRAGLIKDISAGAVLITATGALIIGIIIFLPKIIKLI